MQILKLLLTFLLLITSNIQSLSQSSNSIDSLERQEQNCLDKGKYMLGCAKAFYLQMDSMLNLVYYNMGSKLDSGKRVLFKHRQLQWLTKRDRYFKQTYINFKKSNPDKSPFGSAWGAQDDAMIMYDKNAKFVEYRVLELLNELKNKYRTNH